MATVTGQTTLAELGRMGAAKRHDTRTYARSILRRWPDLPADQQNEIRAILAPIVEIGQ